MDAAGRDRYGCDDGRRLMLDLEGDVFDSLEIEGAVLTTIVVKAERRIP